jgi:hypothetical protein
VTPTNNPKQPVVTAAQALMSTPGVKDVILSDDGSPMKAKRGIPAWYHGKVSSVFARHIFWPSPSKSKKSAATMRRSLFPACASTKVWREIHVQNSVKSKQSVSKPVASNKFYKTAMSHEETSSQSTSNTITALNITDMNNNTLAKVTQKKKLPKKKNGTQHDGTSKQLGRKKSNRKSAVEGSNNVATGDSANAINHSATTLDVPSSSVIASKDASDMLTTDMVATNVESILVSDNDKKRKKKVTTKAANKLTTKGTNRQSKRSHNGKKSSSFTEEQQEDVWLCAKCSGRWGDMADRKKNDDWLACCICQKKFHESCAEEDGIIDDDGSFTCINCL